jgi:hypothetical protein
MLFPLQVVTIISMLAATYLVFRAVGPRRSALLYTRAEKAEWDQQVSKPLGTWLALTNIAGTVTSLATVFLFFIGNSKVFGYWVLICSASIFAGATSQHASLDCLASSVYLRQTSRIRPS